MYVYIYLVLLKYQCEFNDPLLSELASRRIDNNYGGSVKPFNH